MEEELNQDIVKSFQEEFKENGIDKNIIITIFQRLIEIRNKIVEINKTTNFFTSLAASGGENNRFASKRIILNNNRDNDIEQRHLLFEAYEQIQKLRQYLTGEVLTYNLYIATTGKKGSKIKKVSVTGDQLLNYFTLGKKEISLRQAAIRQAVMDEDEASKLQKRWEELIETCFRHPSGDEGAGNLWIYTKKDILRKHDANPPPPKVGSVQVFNLGHIVEAVDQANAQIPPEKNFYSLFEEALEYDSVSGFKGGDNGMVQVKANQARLMRYSSIMNALDAVCSLQDSFTNPAEAMGKIKDLYFSSNTPSEVSTRIQEFIEETGEELTSVLSQVAK